jgi:FkbH-like protein
MYRERRARDAMRVQVSSVEEYLAALEIEVQVSPGSQGNLPRLQQLFQRTNQFNTTTRRYTLGVLAERLADESWRLYALHVRDRFGDHGLVAAALVQASPSAWVLDNLVMSCRVIGYGIETSLLATITADAWASSAARLEADFIPTSKNAPASDLFARHGFRAESSGGGGNGSRWILERTDTPPQTPSWIRMVSHVA